MVISMVTPLHNLWCYCSKSGRCQPTNYIFINPCGAGAGLFWKDLVNTMAADVLATWGARASAAMVLTIQIKQLVYMRVVFFFTNSAISMLRNNRKKNVLFPQNISAYNRLKQLCITWSSLIHTVKTVCKCQTHKRQIITQSILH